MSSTGGFRSFSRLGAALALSLATLHASGASMQERLEVPTSGRTDGQMSWSTLTN
jgi:hypothetical protein